MATRRAFIKGLAASAFIGACATQPGSVRPSPRVRRIGWISGNAIAPTKERSLPFFERMGELGYVRGRDFDVEWQIADTKIDRLPAMAAELLAPPVDLIVAEAKEAQTAAHLATATIPIVFVLSADPLAAGFVASIDHPGGNMTGTKTGSIPASEKRVELLKDTVRGLARLAVLWNGNDPGMLTTIVPATAGAARTLKIETTTVFPVRNLTELDMTLERIARDRFDAVVVLSAESVVEGRLDRVSEFANKVGIPQVYADESMVRAGGLMSLNSNRASQFRRTADFVDKIFNGALPGDLPVEEPTQFDLIINLTAVQKLGLTLPQSVLARATELIH